MKPWEMASQALEDAFAAEWNRRVPVGTACSLIDDFGYAHETRTMSGAWRTDSGHWLISVDGRTGGYLLRRILPHATPPGEPS